MISQFEEYGRSGNSAEFRQGGVWNDGDQIRNRIQPFQIIGEDCRRFLSADAVAVIVYVGPL